MAEAQEAGPQGSSGAVDALTRSFRRMFQVPVVYWAIAMVVAAATALFSAPLERSEQLVPVAAPAGLALWWIIGILALVLVGLLVLIPLAAATTRAALAVFRGEPLRFDMLLAGFRRFGAVLGIGLATAVPILIAAVAGAVVAASIIASVAAELAEPGYLIVAFGIGVLVAVMLLIPAVYVLLRWSFAYFIVFDEGRGAFEALGRSWHLTQDRVLTLLGIAFVTGISGWIASMAPPLLVFTTGWAPLAIGEVYMEARSGRPAPVRNWDRETWADRVVVRDDED